MKYKKNPVKFLVSFVCICVWSFACSSLPKKIESRTMTFAAMNMRLAREAQKSNQYLKAARLYSQAYDEFTRIDIIKGKIDAGLSVARQYFYLDKHKESKRWLKRVSQLIQGEFAYMEASRSLLLVEMAFDKKEYKEVIRIADTVTTENEQWKLELLSYAMIARFNLNLDYSADWAEVETRLPRFYKQFKKHKLKDPEVLSLAYYNCAYIYIRKQQWRNALNALHRAREIDQVMDNSYGLANDLLAMARCYRELGILDSARDSYWRASEIFYLINDSEKAKGALLKGNAVK